jgi:DNA-binding MarR family transcriptional regulator
VDLSAAACWLLARFADAQTTPALLAHTYGLEPDRLALAETELRTKGLIARDSRRLTPAGRDVLDRLRAARRDGLAELVADWSPEQHRELSEFIRRVSDNLVSEAPAR